MINKNLHGDPDEYADGTGYGAEDLNAPPEAAPPDNGYTNSAAVLGPQGDPAEAAMMPSEGGVRGETLAGLGMMIQGAQLLSTHVPGFVPQEITAWLQQSMQVLPQLVDQMQSGLAGGMAGAGMGPMMGGQTGGLGPANMPSSQGAAPAGPPRQ